MPSGLCTMLSHLAPSPESRQVCSFLLSCLSYQRRSLLRNEVSFVACVDRKFFGLEGVCYTRGGARISIMRIAVDILCQRSQRSSAPLQLQRHRCKVLRRHQHVVGITHPLGRGSRNHVQANKADAAAGLPCLGIWQCQYRSWAGHCFLPALEQHW